MIDARRGPAAIVAVAALACGGGGGDAGAPGAADTLVDAPAPATVRADLGESFGVAYGGTAVVGGGALVVEFRRLAEESRCPPGAACPTAGNAAVELGIETSDGAAATLTLHTDRSPAQAPAHGYRVRLVDLSPGPPAPGATIDTSAYVATLEVVEAGG